MTAIVQYAWHDSGRAAANDAAVRRHAVHHFSTLSIEVEVHVGQQGIADLAPCRALGSPSRSSLSQPSASGLRVALVDALLRWA